jgi:hypothetical protein
LSLLEHYLLLSPLLLFLLLFSSHAHLLHVFYFCGRHCWCAVPQEYDGTGVGVRIMGLAHEAIVQDGIPPFYACVAHTDVGYDGSCLGVGGDTGSAGNVVGGSGSKSCSATSSSSTSGSSSNGGSSGGIGGDGFVPTVEGALLERLAKCGLLAFHLAEGDRWTTNFNSYYDRLPTVTLPDVGVGVRSSVGGSDAGDGDGGDSGCADADAGAVAGADYGANGRTGTTKVTVKIYPVQHGFPQDSRQALLVATALGELLQL